MRTAQLLVLTLFFPIGVCSAQTKTQQTKPPPPVKSKPAEAKAKPPKKDKEATSQGKKLHPEQERAYAQAYTTAAVRKP
jgi:hypothetical protein